MLCAFVEKSECTSWAQRYCNHIIRECYTVEIIQNVQVLDIIGRWDIRSDRQHMWILHEVVSSCQLSSGEMLRARITRASPVPKFTWNVCCHHNLMGTMTQFPQLLTVSPHNSCHSVWGQWILICIFYKYNSSHILKIPRFREHLPSHEKDVIIYWSNSRPKLSLWKIPLI